MYIVSIYLCLWNPNAWSNVEALHSKLPLITLQVLAVIKLQAH
jgi:hypothetical protein